MSALETDDDTSLTVKIINAVADQKGADPETLPPLYDVIDADALDRVLRTAADGTGVRVAFTYCGCEVIIHSDQTVTVFPTEPPTISGTTETTTTNQHN